MQVEWSRQQLDVLRERFPKHPEAGARMKDIRNAFVGDRHGGIPFAQQQQSSSAAGGFRR
jgi:hypothetical protein